jgi:protein-tyrosine-phosphatase
MSMVLPFSFALNLELSWPAIKRGPLTKCKNWAIEITRFYALQVEYWPIMDPTATGETREQKLEAYRQARDQIIERLVAKFGPPKEST